jgi:hypothetical protein
MNGHNEDEKSLVTAAAAAALKIPDENASRLFHHIQPTLYKSF